jgi:pyruvate formate lyase activating enzyme
VHALQMVGRDMSAGDVMEVAMRDRDYYATSGGGITLSGGEPMFQPEFALALLQAAKAEGLHTCVETAGTAEWSQYERVARFVDLWLYDWKETDAQLHERFTGRTNEAIRENLKRLHDRGSAILLRCPMIPEFNARKEHTAGIAAIARELPRLKGIELLPYHRLGRSKLERFGFATRMPSAVKPPEPRVFEEWLAQVKNGAPAARVFSGSVTSSRPE